MPRRALAAALALPVLLGGCVSVPKLDEALAAANAVAQTTKVFDAAGNLIAELHAEEDREVIPLSRVPSHLVNAVLAVEDARFWEHPGVDYQAIVRAATRNVEEGQIVQGGSTITQQLVKNTLVENDKTFKRKIREAVLAYQLEQRFSKEQILERYLNTVYFGRGAYGVEAAAKIFFRKSARQLILAESAFLAGMIRSPSRYDPSISATIAKRRRNIVLKRMYDEKMITYSHYRATARMPLRLRPKESTQRFDHPYFVEHVKELIFNGSKEFRRLGETRAERINSVFKGGLRIHTTLDPRLQAVAERAVRRQLPYRSDPYAAFVGVNPKDGGIVAMVGGRDFYNKRDRYARFNMATKSRRQPGSAFKTFTLVAALERGIPLTRVYRGGSRITLRIPGGELWSPRNYEGNAFGSMSLKQATALSVNVIYAQVVLEVGAKAVVDAARRMGIRSELNEVPAITLGSEEVSPLEMANAYATLANGGRYVPATAIRRITDSEGKVLYEAKPKPKQVVTEAVAALATEALQEVMRTGTGRRLTIGRPAAGKTGTSQEYADAWYAGYTTQMAAVTWVGFPKGQIPMRPPRTRIRVFGSSWPGRIWREFMMHAHRGLPVQPFASAREQLVSVKVDVSRNCLPNAFTPSFLIETRTYLRGSEPKDVCTEPRSGEIESTPKVVGMSVADAREALEEAGFQVSAVDQFCPAFKEGTVCDQTPAPNTSSTLGAQAVIYVSDDTAVSEVPMVLGRTVSRARQKLEDAGYRVRIRIRENSSNYAGCRDIFETGSDRVWAQSPCAGSNYGRGSTVTIYVNP